MKLDTQSRQEQIIKISLEIIKNHGIQKLTMREIAKQAGSSEQAIYRHFENKLAILYSIIEYFNEHLSASFKETSTPNNIIEKIRLLIDVHLNYLSENPAFASVIFSEEIFQNEISLVENVREALDKRLNHINELISEGQEKGEIRNDISSEHLAHIFLGTLRLLVTNWRLSSYSFDLRQKSGLILDDMISLIKR